jgi:hypothetical protein
MRDYIEIGPSPAGEECVQLGTENYYELARAECQNFIAFIRKHLGEEPGSAHLRIKTNHHDFGMYLEVVCYYDDEDLEGVEYAFKCESEVPEYWDGVTK